MAANPPMDFQRFRAYLKSLALLLMEPRLRAKFDASDVVQMTLMDASRNQEQFQGTTEEEQRAWLRQILLHDLADELEKYRRAKRDVHLEVAIRNSTRRVQAWRDVAQSTPSSGAVRREQAVRLAEALAQLPDDQRTAVELHHLQEFSIRETSDRMGRTVGSVASLVHRGLADLRRRMAGDFRHD